MIELALKYEYIIRNAHNVRRLGIPAAHADTYRGLERSFARLNENNDARRNEELLFEYAFNCGEVTTNLNNAITEFENRFDGQLTDVDTAELNEIENLLINGKMDDIDQSIELIENVFRRHGLNA